MIDEILIDLRDHLIAKMPAEIVTIETAKSLGLVEPKEFEVSQRRDFKALPVVRLYALGTEQERRFSGRKERYTHSVAIDILVENRKADILERQLYNYMEAARLALYKFESDLIVKGTIQSVQVTRHVYSPIEEQLNRAQKFRRDVYLDLDIRETTVF